MKTLVIGGSGFLGSCLSHYLIKTGREVVILDHNPNPRYEIPRQAVCIIGDINNRSIISDCVKDVNEIIDLAYSTIPKTSFEDPLNDILSNLPPGVTLLQEATKVTKLKKMVFISSGGTVYGKTDITPIDEHHPTNPISPYGITKLTMEKFALMFFTTTGLPITIARPANAYGEGQLPFTGQGFIPTAIQSIIESKPVSIFGKFGTIRDYIHISDIAQGIISILDYGMPGEAYNIGTGIGYSNLDVLQYISPLAKSDGFSIEINTLPERPFDVPTNILNSNKLESISGWRARTTFSSGINQVWANFLRNNKKNKE